MIKMSTVRVCCPRMIYMELAREDSTHSTLRVNLDSDIDMHRWGDGGEKVMKYYVRVRRRGNGLAAPCTGNCSTVIRIVESMLLYLARATSPLGGYIQYGLDAELWCLSVPRACLEGCGTRDRSRSSLHRDTHTKRQLCHRYLAATVCQLPNLLFFTL